MRGRAAYETHIRCKWLYEQPPMEARRAGCIGIFDLRNPICLMLGGGSRLLKLFGSGDKYGKHSGPRSQSFNVEFYTDRQVLINQIEGRDFDAINSVHTREGGRCSVGISAKVRVRRGPSRGAMLERRCSICAPSPAGPCAPRRAPAQGARAGLRGIAPLRRPGPAGGVASSAWKMPKAARKD